MNPTKIGMTALSCGALFLLTSGGTPRPAPAREPVKRAVAKDDEDAAGGGGQRRFPDSVIYVDGVAVAVLRYAELPIGLTTLSTIRENGRERLRFRFAEYLEKLGVPLERVSAVHFAGGRGRVARLDGAELRRVRETLLFSFSQQVKGKPRMHWAGGVRVNDAIDGIGDIAVYVEKAAPEWNETAWRLELAGKPVEGIPHAMGAPVRGGARVYLDGRLAGAIKRNALPPVASGPHALLPFLQMHLAIDPARIESLELIADERIVGTLGAAALETATFDAIPQSGGRIVVRSHEALAPSAGSETRSAVHGTEAGVLRLRSR